MKSNRQEHTHPAVNGEREAIEDLLRREALDVVFQPIVDLSTADVAGYEALSRPHATTAFSEAAELFDAAGRSDLLDEVEALARRRALAKVDRRLHDAMLFINCSPVVLGSEHFAATFADQLDSLAGLPPHAIVLEITERSAHPFAAEMNWRLLALREKGFRVALDDVGAGISGLNQIMALRPNWMKLDVALVADIDLDPLKQNLIRFFVHFAKLGNMRLVAEGIERLEELRVLIDLGVAYGQGYYLGRPGELGAPVRADVRARIIDLHHHREARTLLDPSAMKLATLVSPAALCDLRDPVRRVAARLAAFDHQPGVVVAHERRYVGWLDRDHVLAAAAKGDEDVLVGSLPLEDGSLVAGELTLAEAMEILASRPDGQLTVPLAVQRDGQVEGIVDLRRLLRAAAEAHRKTPSHVAPLTGLPSRVQADQWIASRIKANDRCAIVFIDLRDFDAYNVAYGFERGDEMLMRLVGLIQTELVESPDGATFFAHLGEDRFMLAFPNDPQSRLVEVMKLFDESLGEFFSSGDLAAQAFRSSSASGGGETYPLTSLRVIYLPCVLERIEEPRDLHFIARRLSLRRLRDETLDRRKLIAEERGLPARAA